MKTFQNKVVWLTGASSGIGEELACQLSRLKCKVIISARNQEALEQVKQRCYSDNANIVILPVDLSRPEELRAKAESVLLRWGKIDCFIHNAGLAVRDLALNTEANIDREVMETNYFGPMLLTKLILPSMIERKSGHIVVVSSLSGKYGVPKLSSYAASKHALHGFFNSLRAEVTSMNIKISMIVPGFINTPIHQHAKDGKGNAYGKRILVNERGMTVQECAEKIIHAIIHEKEEALIGGKEMFSVYLNRFFPKFFSWVIQNHPMRRLRFQ
jgi:dehydrogenase/reductase SDR family protein 7B